MVGKVGKYVVNVLIWVDQGLNVVFIGGDPDETVSSRLGKTKRRFGGRIPWRYPIRKIIDWGLDRIDPGHSQKWIEEDEGDRQINLVKKDSDSKTSA